MSDTINEKKRALLAYKEKILEEIQYYDKRVDEFRTNYKSNCYFDDADSSDSEDYFPTLMDTGPEIPELKLQQEVLKTCLQATQELTNLTILQSQVDVLVEEPQLDGEPPVSESGTWQEVTAECRIDLVPFIISFYMHTPDRKFGSTSYRGLRLSLVKASHEVELSNSVLHTLKRPGDAVEVVRSYAAQYRSRRTTLARIAEKYAGSLFMEPHPEGGFVLKCANLLEILWRLENKWSPIAPFHHRMKFDLEYMDESYLKIITQAHKQLLDPSIQTDERTLLLSKIITTCLEARGPVDSESDLESRLTDVQIDVNAKEKDKQVMAPPKSLPKKTKKVVAKDKNLNKEESKAKIAPQKRPVEDDSNPGNSKKIKTAEDSNSGAKTLKVKGKEAGQKKNDDTSEKDKNNPVDNEVIKKKSNEKQDVAKNIKNSKVKQTNKTNDQNDVEVVSNKNNVANINENKNNTEKPNTAQKRKNDNNGPVETKVAKKNNKELKKSKSNEELKRRNVESGESNRKSANPKRVKSSSDINKTDRHSTNNKKTDKAPTSVNIGNKENEHNNIIVNKESENVATSSKIVKQKNKDNKNDVSSKKTTRKSTMSVANDKKFDQITKKISGTVETKSGSKVSKTVNNPKKTFTDSKSKSEENNPETAPNTNETNQQRPKNEEAKTATNPKNVKSQNMNTNTTTASSKSNKIIKKKSEIVSENNTCDHPKPKDVKTKTTINTKNAKPQNIEANKKKLTEIAKSKNSGNTNCQTVKTVTEKNANSIKNKENITNVNKIVKDKPNNSNKPELVNNTKMPRKSITNKNLTKLTTQSVRNIIHKSPGTRNILKVQSSLKTNSKDSNMNRKFSNIAVKETGRISKIPQKKISLSSEINLKTNIVRISPRKLPSKFKTISKNTNGKDLAKPTNIPRFVKKVTPKPLK